MHSPQRMQVRRNSLSGKAPGGRMSCSLSWSAVNGDCSNQEPQPHAARRRVEKAAPREVGRASTPHPGASARATGNGSPPADRRHAGPALDALGECVCRPRPRRRPSDRPPGTAPQAGHSGPTVRRRRPSGDSRLSSAPSGHRYRHQNRGARRLRANDGGEDEERDQRHVEDGLRDRTGRDRHPAQGLARRGGRRPAPRLTRPTNGGNRAKV